MRTCCVSLIDLYQIFNYSRLFSWGNVTNIFWQVGVWFLTEKTFLYSCPLDAQVNVLVAIDLR